MPLERTPIKYTQHNPPDVIGFWMAINGADPVSPVRVFVTAGALEHLEPSQPRDPFAAADIFEKHRDLIDGLASDKFDKGRVEGETHEGMPVVRISSDDVP
jgi:Protein of unknown function (DUF1488)